MPLHRDIHWIGRQWAVTGHGMQLIDQKLQGFFDVEVSRLWDDDLIEALHAKEWLNMADFDKGLSIARARYPQPAGVAAPPAKVTRPLAIESVAPIAEVAKPIAPKPETPKAEIPRAETPRAETPKLEKPNPVEPPNPPPTLFQMRYECRARFVRPWRVVARKI